MASSRHVWNLNVFDRFVLSSWQRFEEGATVEFIQKYILRIYVHPLIEAARSNRRVLNFLQFFVFAIFTILIFLLIFFSYFISLFLTAFPIVNFFVQIISRNIYLLFQNRAQINMEFVDGEESPWKFQWLQASPIDSRRPRRRLIFPINLLTSPRGSVPSVAMVAGSVSQRPVLSSPLPATREFRGGSRAVPAIPCAEWRWRIRRTWCRRRHLAPPC